MLTLFRTMLILLMMYWPVMVMAGGPETQIVKKPDDLRTKGDRSQPFSFTGFTLKDRQKWKSVLNWCDECDERAKPFTEDDNGINGGMDIFPMGDNQYLVDINCEMTMRQCEHIYYKVTEHADTIESRLLILEQFYHAEYNDDDIVKGVTNPKGEFVRSFDSVAYGFTIDPVAFGFTSKHDNNAKPLIVEVEYRGVGGCGLFTIYDISGDSPKVIEFRANVECTSEYVPPEKYKLYPPEQRAKWRIVPNPRRYDWKKTSSSTPACSK